MMGWWLLGMIPSDLEQKGLEKFQVVASEGRGPLALLRYLIGSCHR